LATVLYETAPPAVLDQGVVLANAYFYATDEELPALILTPTCDFENKKVDLVHLCPLWDAWEVVRELLVSDWERSAPTAREWSENKKSNFTGLLRQLITQRFPRYHWLTPLPGHSDPRVIDFQNIASLPTKDLERSTIVTRLRSPFREQVSARYSSYMGRVGTPDFETPEIDSWLRDAVGRFSPPPPPARAMVAASPPKPAKP